MVFFFANCCVFTGVSRKNITFGIPKRLLVNNFEKLLNQDKEIFGENLFLLLKKIHQVKKPSLCMSWLSTFVCLLLTHVLFSSPTSLPLPLPSPNSFVLAKTLREEILTKASCYYYATYVRMECPTLSFPWMVVPKLLSAILTGDDDHFLQAVHLVPRIFSQPRGRPKEGITNEFF